MRPSRWLLGAALGDFYNMSYLQSNSAFSAAGGVEGPSNKFDIYGVRVVRVKSTRTGNT